MLPLKQSLEVARRLFLKLMEKPLLNLKRYGLKLPAPSRMNSMMALSVSRKIREAPTPQLREPKHLQCALSYLNLVQNLASTAGASLYVLAWVRCFGVSFVSFCAWCICVCGV